MRLLQMNQASLTPRQVPVLPPPTIPQTHPHGPPYAPTTAGLGGLPTTHLDVPITSVFMTLFLLGAVGHFTLLQLNNRRGHKFNMSGALFGFSMARVSACMMRIVWATQPKNTSVAIAASLLVAVGDLLGSVVNLNFTHRIIRALHPSIGWSKPVTWAFASLYALIVISVILLISFSVESYYTLNPAKLHTAHHVLLYGSSYFATAAVLPIILLLFALLKPRTSRAENFGRYGSMRSKILITVWGASLLALGAWFRAGTGYLKPRPASHAAWYQSKACFYVFYFTIEVMVIWSYFFLRIDQRFHVPDGANGPGEYSGAVEVGAGKGKEEHLGIVGGGASEEYVLQSARRGFGEEENGHDVVWGAREPIGTMWNSSEEHVVSPMASFEDGRLEPKVVTSRALGG